MNVDIQEVEKLSEKFDGTHKFLSEDILVPNLNCCDSIRINMFTNHLPQALVLSEPSFPHVFTNFENAVGKYSTSYLKADRDWEIVERIDKSEFVSCIVLKDKKNNIDVVNIQPATRITERFGYKINNNIKDKNVNDIINKDDVIFRSTTYDDNMNFCYGQDLRACFIALDNMTYEDSIVISKSAAKKLSNYSVDEIDITLNTNDVLLNIKGDKNEYKCFPHIGESSNNAVIAARRRLNYKSMLFDFSSSNIRKIDPDNDTLFYTAKDSIVYDVEIFYNCDIKSISNYPYYSQILKYIELNETYYTEIRDRLGKYVNDPKYKCSSDAKYMYKRAYDIMDVNRQYKFDGNTFDNMVIKIKTYNVNPLVVGSKITGR